MKNMREVRVLICLAFMLVLMSGLVVADSYENQAVTSVSIGSVTNNSAAGSVQKTFTDRNLTKILFLVLILIVYVYLVLKRRKIAKKYQAKLNNGFPKKAKK